MKRMKTIDNRTAEPPQARVTELADPTPRLAKMYVGRAAIGPLVILVVNFTKY
jgi:hypothetical protein